jgi:hypothetical protein
MSPRLYKLLLAIHLIVSVGWLGIVIAKAVLGLAAVTSDVAGHSAAMYVSMDVLNVAFPPVAIGTLVTGVLLSLGTKWGLLRHYWVATKLVLTVGVIVTAVQLGDRAMRSATSAPAGDGTMLGIAWPPATLLLSLAVAHVLMLAVATVVSVYKPWGRTPFARPGQARIGRNPAADVATTSPASVLSR